MTDLDERERSFDAVLRAAGLRLRDDLARSAVPSFRAPRLTHRRRWVIVVAVSIAVIVGLVAIGTNRNDRSIGNDPARLRWLVKDLPQGWKATGVFDPSATEINQLSSLINMYATPDSWRGPLLSVQGSMGPNGQSVVPGQIKSQTNYHETTIDGRKAVFADDSGTRILYIEIGDHWVFLKSRMIADAELTALGQSVVLKSDGSAEIPATALVDGLQLVAPASAPIDSMILPRKGTPVAVSNYQGPTDGSMTLAVGRPRSAPPAFAALSYTLEPIKIGNAQGFIGSFQVDSDPPSTVWIAYWEREGLAFSLTGQGVSRADVVTAAESVDPASASAWTALLQTTVPVAPAGTTPAADAPPGATTAAGDAPPGTDPPYVGEPHDVTIDVSVAQPSANEQLWSGTFPTGETWSVKVVQLYDSISMWPAINGVAPGSMSGPLRRDPGAELGCCGPVSVVTANPKASSLRVMRHNGDRYTIPLHELPGTDGLRVAVIALPEAGPQQAELIDMDGNVLEALPGGG